MNIFKYFFIPLQLVGFVVFFAIAMEYSPVNAKTYTREQVLNDIDILVKTLKKTQPNLYAHRSKNEFNTIVKNIRDKVLFGGDYYEIAPHFQQILAAVCDEHTRIQMRTPFDEEGGKSFDDLLKDEKLMAEYLRPRFLKANLIITADNIYLDNPAITFNRQTLHNINGNGVPWIQKVARSITSADGCAQDNILLTRLLPISHRIVLSSMLRVSGHHSMSAKSVDDKSIRRYTGPVHSLSELFFQNPRDAAIVARIAYLKEIDIKLTKDDFLGTAQNPTHGIVVKSNPDKSIYYIYSSSFLGEKKQTKRTNKLLREMIGNKPDHVILDLTDNPGGKLRTASHFLSYFLDKSHAVATRVRMISPGAKTPANFTYFSKDRRKFHRQSKNKFRRVRRKNGRYTLPFRKAAFGNPDYKGDLSVLVSPRTHSAATAVASVLKRQRKAKLMGYLNTGSARTSCFAAFGYFTLPATKLKVLIPDTCFDRPKNNAQKGDILDLDINVDPLGSATSILSARILKAALDTISR